MKDRPSSFRKDPKEKQKMNSGVKKSIKHERRAEHENQEGAGGVGAVAKIRLKNVLYYLNVPFGNTPPRRRAEAQ